MIAAVWATVVVVAMGGCAGSADGAGARASTQPMVVEPIRPFRQPLQTTVGSGDTIESVCRRLAGSDWVQWRDALMTQLDPRKLQPGTVFSGVLERDGSLGELEVELDMRTGLSLVQTADGIAVDRIERPIDRDLLRIEGEIESSLFGAVEAAGAGPELAVRLAEIFQWDIDFFRDLRKGDRFIVVVDRESIDGDFYGYGTIFAARFVNRGHILDALVFPDVDGRLGYYDEQGRPLRKQFLRSPLKFSRVTSSFTLNRFHPVLKRKMPHYGVDYGAPVGTPVRVTADGTVTFVGRNGGAGKMIRVRHPNGYETNYLHLSGYASGIRNGARVDQGQVIGYVGSTGWATGPHLDYRVRVNGRWVNPLSITSPPAKPLDETHLKRFLNHALNVLRLLEGREPAPGARC